MRRAAGPGPDRNQAGSRRSPQTARAAGRPQPACQACCWCGLPQLQLGMQEAHTPAHSAMQRGGVSGARGCAMCMRSPCACHCSTLAAFPGPRRARHTQPGKRTTRCMYTCARGHVPKNSSGAAPLNPGAVPVQFQCQVRPRAARGPAALSSTNALRLTQPPSQCGGGAFTLSARRIPLPDEPRTNAARVSVIRSTFAPLGSGPRPAASSPRSKDRQFPRLRPWKWRPAQHAAVSAPAHGPSPLPNNVPDETPACEAPPQRPAGLPE